MQPSSYPQQQRHIPTAQKMPQLKRLKDTARSADDVRRKLSELGACTTGPEFALVVSTYSRLREWRAACDTIAEMEQLRLPPDGSDKSIAVAYSQAILACDKARQWQQAVQLIEGMQAASRVAPNEFHYSGAISACAKCGQHQVAMRLFDGYRKQGIRPNEVVYNATLSACAKGDTARVHQLLDEMRNAGIAPSVKTYAAAIGACGSDSWRDGMQLLDRMESDGLRPDSISYNTTIKAVGDAGEWQVALQVLERMKKRNAQRTTVTYTSVICALAEGGQYASAYKMLSDMRNDGVQPDQVCYNAAMGAAASDHDADKALSLHAEMQRMGLKPSARSFTSLISACGKARQTTKALELLREMEAVGLQPGSHAYSAAISACEKGGMWQKGLELLDEMERRGVTVERATINAAIAACQKGGQYEKALELLDSMGRRGLQPDIISFNSALAALHTAGESDTTDAAQKLARTLQMLEQMKVHGPTPDSISYGTAINACAKALNLPAAERLLVEVNASGTAVVDAGCYNALLRVCEKVGAWERALRVEVEMAEAGVAPEVPTYTLLMQCLAAARQLDEGFALLDRLPTDVLPQSFPIHHALVQACRAANDEQRTADASARIDANGLTNISPEAIIHVPDGRGGTDSVTHITGSFEPELAKVVNDLVYDCKRSTSYRVQLSAVPLDRVKDSVEKQEMSLRNHPEKKALADLLCKQRDRGLAFDEGGDLEIAINFRVCTDCHAFFKGCSKLLRRRVVLHEQRRRDPARSSANNKSLSLASTTHLFEGGICSCGQCEEGGAQPVCAVKREREGETTFEHSDEHPKRRRAERRSHSPSSEEEDAKPTNDSALL